MRAVLSVTVFVASVASAQEGNGRLQLGEVLQRSAAASPAILAARESLVAERADLLAAEGSFDRKIEVDARSRATGFYDGSFVDARFVEPFENLGGEYFAGYRIGPGNFPIYEDEYVTLEGGEFNFGATLALLRDRRIDSRRFKLLQSELEVEIAELDLLLEAIEIQHEAMRAYWLWVLAGQRLRILEDLLDYAYEQSQGLQRRVSEGDLAQVTLLENSQQILQRRTLVAGAERDLENAAITLGLYLRGPDGGPQVPGRDQLPTLPRPSTTAREGGMRDEILDRQVELAVIDRRLELASRRRELGENELKPQVDVGFKVERDIGDGDVTREETDLILGLQFSVPLERRLARGRIAAAEAEMRELEFRRQMVEERLAANLGMIEQRMRIALEVARYARAEVEVAQGLEVLEQTSFREGASSFFLLNIRENATADARLKEANALADFYLAEADYLAITVDLDALGLGRLSPE